MVLYNFALVHKLSFSWYMKLSFSWSLCIMYYVLWLIQLMGIEISLCRVINTWQVWVVELGAIYEDTYWSDIHHFLNEHLFWLLPVPIIRRTIIFCIGHFPLFEIIVTIASYISQCKTKWQLINVFCLTMKFQVL